MSEVIYEHNDVLERIKIGGVTYVDGQQLSASDVLYALKSAGVLDYVDIRVDDDEEL